MSAGRADSKRKRQGARFDPKELANAGWSNGIPEAMVKSADPGEAMRLTRSATAPQNLDKCRPLAETSSSASLCSNQSSSPPPLSKLNPAAHQSSSSQQVLHPTVMSDEKKNEKENSAESSKTNTNTNTNGDKIPHQNGSLHPSPEEEQEQEEEGEEINQDAMENMISELIEGDIMKFNKRLSIVKPSLRRELSIKVTAMLGDLAIEASKETSELKIPEIVDVDD